MVKESTNAENADYVIPIMDDSMEPTYHNGDKAFVEKCDSKEISSTKVLFPASFPKTCLTALRSE